MKNKLKSKASVLFQPMSRRVPMGRQVSVLDLALHHKIPIDHSCGGSGSCGTCRVKILKGLSDLADRGDVEQAMADARQFTDDERLACQIEPVPDLEVFVSQQEVEEGDD